VDVTTTHEQKMACLRAHQSQVTDTTLAALATWFGFRGLQQARRGLKFGEAFRAARACGRPAPVSLLAELWRDDAPKTVPDPT
jgi:LmbE family N-acetylglucosaminyl deacetylase